MEALEALKRTTAVTGHLQSLVRTMKVLAGVNIRNYERAAQAVAAYNQTIELGLQIALRSIDESALPPKHAPGRKMAAVVFGSDQGMCGQLNDLIVQHAIEATRRLAVRRADQRLLAVGVRAADQLE